MFQEPIVDQAFEPSFRRSAYLFAVELPGKAICGVAGIGMGDEVSLPFVHKGRPRFKDGVTLLRLAGMMAGIVTTLGLNEMCQLPKRFWYAMTFQESDRFIEPSTSERYASQLPYFRASTIEDRFKALQH
ncbi:hypothetical protein CMO91_02445 [Candidatus Woesearchaeota archaeon]|nr:hypothetical protein [Candidatus Woesearchaeota archaeon]|tara:strand:+ start:392 stop:781 length:390 start_codon:yes stop_codon:yes gene_type:complete